MSQLSEEELLGSARRKINAAKVTAARILALRFLRGTEWAKQLRPNSGIRCLVHHRDIGDSYPAGSLDAQRSVCEVRSKKQMWAQLCEAATEDGTGARWVSNACVYARRVRLSTIAVACKLGTRLLRYGKACRA